SARPPTRSGTCSPTFGRSWAPDVRRLFGALRARATRTIGAQVLTAFELTLAVAVLVALVSLSATKEATDRLEALQETQQRMVSAVKDLELGAELQSDSVQAYLLSGDQRYLEDQARGQQRFAEAYDML